MSIDLEAIEDRTNAATPGPWHTKLGDGVTFDIQAVVTSATGEICGHRQLGYRDARNYENNAAFIAHAREDVPALLALVKQQAEQLSSVTAERDAAVETMSNLLKHSDDDICAYCKNRVECKEKECDCYEHGKGAVDMDGNEHPDFEWTCEDFNYGTCQKMKGTKCEKCFENGYSGFEWVGIGKEQNNGN